MHLKGEKEFKIEALYDSINAEYEELSERIINRIKETLENKDLDQFSKVDLLGNLGNTLKVYTRIVEAIYDMDLEMDEIDTFKELSDNKELLIALSYSFFDSDKESFKQKIKEVSKLSCSLTTLRKVREDNESNSTL